MFQIHYLDSNILSQTENEKLMSQYTKKNTPSALQCQTKSNESIAKQAVSYTV